jgi:hypothetical protein
MKKLSPADILPNDVYLRQREERVRAIITLKERRRVAVGDLVSLTFENRVTARHQIQEMCRVERITDPAMVAAEVEVYNSLIPGPGELSATLFIEIADSAAIKPTLDRLIGLDRPGVLTLHIGDSFSIDAVWEPATARPGASPQCSSSASPCRRRPGPLFSPARRRRCAPSTRAIEPSPSSRRRWPPSFAPT